MFDLEKPYRRGAKRKEAIAKNLIDFMESKAALSEDSAEFIYSWVRGGRRNKTHYDIWEMVLNEYNPVSRPTLYRSCKKIKNRPSSFTGSIYCAKKFSNPGDFLIICDTERAILKCSHPGKNFHNAFFPLAELVKKEAESPNCKFEEGIIKQVKEEDEYIMMVDLGVMYSCRWTK